MNLYTTRLLELEKDFDYGKDELERLIADLNEGREDLDRAEIKLRIDLITAHIRLIKERAAFLMKLGQRYDIAVFIEDLNVRFREMRDEKLGEIIEWIDRRWMEAISDGDIHEESKQKDDDGEPEE